MRNITLYSVYTLKTNLEFYSHRRYKPIYVFLFVPISGINRPDISQSGSSAHLNVQLGPLQMWPYYNNGECKSFLYISILIYFIGLTLYCLYAVKQQVS